MTKPKNRIIFPLDVPSATEAKALAALLSDNVGMFKIGLELFIQAGPDIVREIREIGNADIFLDLKLHDIPATVSRAMSRVAELGVRFVTVHCGESIDMLKAAVDGGGGKVGVLGVTVLTSVSPEDIREAGFAEPYASDINRLVLKRAEMARNAGCAGIVCSAKEAQTVKSRFGSSLQAVTPGIRPAWGLSADDQKRVMTPAAAIEMGADYLVIGRPIRDADDPKAAAEKIAAEIASVIPGGIG